MCSFSLPHYIFLLGRVVEFCGSNFALLTVGLYGIPVYAVIAVSIFPCGHKSYQTSPDFLILTSGDSGNDVLRVVSMEIPVRIPGMSHSEFLL